MDEYSIDNSPVVATHLLQHTLRNLCCENSLWIYAVFWRILPRNHPPPDWYFLQKGAHNRYRVNRRNWMLAWEDGFCNFLASTAGSNLPGSSSSEDKNCDIQLTGLQPELFFKMSHEIHNYGEGLIGKVAADRGHKSVYSEQINLSVWQNSIHLPPRTWKAQFQSGIKTISLIAVDEGVLQLGALRKVPEDLIYVAEIQKKFKDLQIIPGFLLPRPSSSPPSPSPIHSTTFPFQVTAPIFIHNPFPIKAFNGSIISTLPDDQYYETSQPVINNATAPLTSIMDDVSDYFNKPPMQTFLSMNSLEKLLMKLPSVAPPPSSKSLPPFRDESLPWFSPSQYPLMGMDQEKAKDHQMIQIHHEQRTCP